MVPHCIVLQLHGILNQKSAQAEEQARVKLMEEPEIIINVRVYVPQYRGVRGAVSIQGLAFISFNSLVSARHGLDYKIAIFYLVLLFGIFRSFDNALR